MIILSDNISFLDPVSIMVNELSNKWNFIYVHFYGITNKKIQLFCHWPSSAKFYTKVNGRVKKKSVLHVKLIS